MYKFERMLVCLDLSNMDDLLIMYADYISKLIDVEKVTFLHVMEDSNFPEELSKEFPELAEPLDDIIKEELEEKVAKNYSKNGVESEIKLVSGNTTEQILGYAREFKVDLTLVGKKSGFKGTGVVLGKLAKFIHSSILFLPESARHTFEKVLVPVDFSSESQIALQEAINISDKAGAEVEIQHVYELPAQYFPYNSPADVLKNKMKKHLDVKYQKFMKGVDTHGKGINYFFSLNEDKTMTEVIYNRATSNQCDLIVLGSKTKTAASALFKGSTAEKLAKANYSIPLMVIKDKNKTMGLFEALFK
jgi:nucleotide-binding universal stress UspA family protein